VPRVSLRPKVMVRVTSSRYPDQQYLVTLHQDGTWSCDEKCPAYRHGSRADGQCRHIDQVREAVLQAALLADALAQ
jgi:hypothetical protein